MAKNDVVAKAQVDAAVAQDVNGISQQIQNAMSVLIGDFAGSFPPETSPPLQSVTHTLANNTGGYIPNNPYGYVQVPAHDWAIQKQGHPVFSIGSHAAPLQTPNVGDICYLTEKDALCIYDGESWKALIKAETLKESFQEFKKEETKVVKDMARFLDLELDGEDQLPKNMQDELVTQAFRLKIHRLLESIKEEENGTKIPSDPNGEGTQGST